MMSFGVWTILGIITPILRIIYFRAANAVWGGFTLGLILGLIIASINAFLGNGFDWYIIGQGGISGTLAGFLAEMLGKLSHFIKSVFVPPSWISLFVNLSLKLS